VKKCDARKSAASSQLIDVKKKIQSLEDKGTGSAQEDLKKAQDRVTKAELAIADAEERLSRAQERAVSAEKSAEIALKEGATAAAEAQKKFEADQEAKRQIEARAREAEEKNKNDETVKKEADDKLKKDVEEPKPVSAVKSETAPVSPKPASPKPARKGRPMEVGVLTFTDIDAIRENISNIQVTTNHFGWITIGYTGQTKLSIQATGYKSVEELAEHLKDEQIQYALLRVGVDFDRDQKVTKTRDILIVWYGPKVKMLEKCQKNFTSW